MVINKTKKLLQKLCILSIIMLGGAGYVTAKDSQCEEDDEQCVDVGAFNLSVALGGGVRTTPLHGGSNIPLVIVPDISWYGERFYIDNTELGYSWTHSETFAVETFLSLNSERGNFVQGHASNFILADIGLESGALPSDNPVAPPPPDGDEEEGEADSPVFSDLSERILQVDDVSERDWAIDIGIRMHWYLPNSEWRLSLLQDASSVHHGQQAHLSYLHRVKWQKWQFTGALGATWKSANLLDYYYGVDIEDNVTSDLFYDASSGIVPYVQLGAQRKLTEDWRLLFHARYTLLPNSMTDSPLVDEDHTLAIFAGAAYRF